MAKVYKNPGPIEFEAVIQEDKIGNNTAVWIDFPYDLKETFGVGNLVPFRAAFDGRVHYQGSLAKMGGSQAMILLRSDVRKELGKEPGERVNVLVELDTSERKVELGKDEEKALKQAGLLEKYRALPFSHQREYHLWIDDAKQAETRARRITKMVDAVAALKKAAR
jgi:hypothetical protein